MSAHTKDPVTTTLPSHPEEPIIALDDINEHDTYALEAPVERSFDAVKDAYSKDPVVCFFARPGQNCEFVAALLRSVRQKARFSVYECCSFSAVALVRDTEEEGVETLSAPQPRVKDAEAVAGLIESESTQALGVLGYSSYDAHMLELVRPETMQAFEAYQNDTKKMLCEYAKSQECGGHHVLYLQFLATSEAVQRKGLATKLINHLIATADAHGKALYVEVTQKRHWNFFSELGFTPWKDYKIGGADNIEGAPEIVIMVRTPKPHTHTHGGGGGKKGLKGDANDDAAVPKEREH